MHEAFACYKHNSLPREDENVDYTADKDDQTSWAVVVTQLAERLLAILEIRGSNPVIGKTL